MKQLLLSFVTLSLAGVASADHHDSMGKLLSGVNNLDSAIGLHLEGLTGENQNPVIAAVTEKLTNCQSEVSEEQVRIYGDSCPINYNEASESKNVENALIVEGRKETSVTDAEMASLVNTKKITSDYTLGVTTFNESSYGIYYSADSDLEQADGNSALVSTSMFQKFEGQNLVQINLMATVSSEAISSAATLSQNLEGEECTLDGQPAECEAVLKAMGLN
jgi:hypothetical protein